MGRGYYWIESTDKTINEFRFNKFRITDKPRYDRRSGMLEVGLWPGPAVGDILKAPGCDAPSYVVASRYKDKRGVMINGRYMIRMLEDTWESANRLRKGMFLYRSGFMHGKGSL